jgi:acyl-CoA thioesterase
MGAAPSVANDWPANFFAKKNPHQGIQYKRVRHLVFSSYRGNKVVWTLQPVEAKGYMRPNQLSARDKLGRHLTRISLFERQIGLKKRRGP